MKRALFSSLTLGLCAALAAEPGRAEPSRPGAVATVTADTTTETVSRCVAAHESARLARVREQWLEAREAMSLCADDGCPLAIRSDCRAWLDELARLMPTLLIVVERDDDRTQSLDLELDGRPLTLPEPLGPIELLPGTHRLRASLKPFAPIEREIVLEKGAKNQVVRLRFVREKSPAESTPATAAARPPLAAAPPRSSRPVPPLAYWFGGGALLALGTSGVLLGSALSSLDSARETCAPGCNASVRDSIDARLLAADIVGSAGIALAGFALVTFINRPTVVEPGPDLRAGFGLSDDGAGFALSGRF